MKVIKSILVSILTIIFIFNCNIGFADNLSNDKEIIIDIPSRKLFLTENNEVIKEYPVAVGTSATQTPIGQYKVINKIIDPYYAKLDIPGGSRYNPLGSRWIGFKPHYGIHGNSNPSSIGTFASAGCVRMFEMDVQELYNTVSYNVPVKVTYELLKILKDVDGENPIIAVYPDYYNYETDINLKIDKKLKEIGLYESISKEDLTYLKNRAKKEITYISNGYAYFINDTYITNDVINYNQGFYINKTKFERFFNINMNSIYGEEYCAFREDKIHQVSKDGKNYIAISDLERVFGGSHTFDESDWSLKYDLDNYILLNGSLIRGQGIALIEYPIIPLYDLIELLNIDMKITKEKIKFIYQGKELKILYHNGEPYISIENVNNVLGVKTNLHTGRKFIELSTDPVVIYNDNIFNGLRENNEILVPLSIFSTELLSNDLNTVQEHILSIGRLKTFNRSGKSYVKLSEVLKMKGYQVKKKDSYGTKIYIEKRIF